MARDEITVRRWFRHRLEAIAKAYPDLTDPDHQAACDRWLTEEQDIERDTAKEETGKAAGERQV